MDSTEKTRREFDQAAIAMEQYAAPRGVILKNRDFLLKYVPERIENALEVGCGLGDFARFISRRADHVLALDLSPEMIRVARERSMDYSNIEYVIADATEYDLPPNKFDFVSSFMTLHHMPIEAIYEKVASTVKPGGTLIVFDMCKQEGFRNAVFSVYRNFFVRNLERALRRLLRGKSRRTRRGMHDHDPDEVFPTVAEVSRVCHRVMPGALIREQYGAQRYSIVWKKP
ncbi:MAG: class I SAM-dependent methyltransferase [Chloroflexota bacterium]